jgi:hypothetical protein
VKHSSIPIQDILGSLSLIQPLQNSTLMQVTLLMIKC